MASCAVEETVSLDEKQRNVTWCGGEVRNDIGGKIRLVIVEELSFANEVKCEEVSKEILCGAGVEESKRAKGVTLMRLDLEGNGVISL